jgi:histidinol-phosphate phosphatase family protein
VTSYDVVVPTTGRPSLTALLVSLAAVDGPLPERVLVVDDRPAGTGPSLALQPPGPIAGRTYLLRGDARGPAAARNAGWRAGAAEWVAFLDDDVLPVYGWRAALAADLRALDDDVVATQGRVRVLRDHARRPTDWERNVAGLEDARWATADMAFRRRALHAAGGFDERFPRAYREDSDLGLRLVAAGGRIVRGRRTVLHPVTDAGAWVSLHKQQGNADDALMHALHGRRWRERAGAPRGRLARHAVIAAAGGAAVAAAAAGRRALAGSAAAAWLAGTGELAWARIAPGPRTRDEVVRMALTSAALPFTATWHRGRGELRARRLARRPGPFPDRPEAVLLDRDGTLVDDVPYNGDPARVQLLPGVRDGLDRLRAAGIRLAVVSNQSGITRGLITREQVDAVNARLVELLGPLEPICVCPHDEAAGCACRKPAPGLVHEACARLGVAPDRCALIGDIGADVEAARRAGARPIVVPTPRTRREEVASAPERVTSFRAAVDRLLAGAPARTTAPLVRVGRSAHPSCRPTEAVA